MRQLNPALPALLAGTLLFIATLGWVPPQPIVAFPAYFNDTLIGQIHSRALIGTLRQLLDLDETAFRWMLQAFRLGWLLLVCLLLMRHITNRPVAICLCAMFAFATPLLIPTVVVGLVDAVEAFWVVAACTLLLRPAGAQTPPRWQFLTAASLLFLGVLTHEKALFINTVFIAWLALRYGWRTLWLVIPLSLACIPYMAAIWHEPHGRENAQGYFNHLFAPHPILADSVNVMGIVTSACALWGVYALTLIAAAQTTSQRRTRLLYWLAGLAGSFATLLFAVDTQRMLGIIWLPMLILLVDLAPWFNRHFTSIRARSLWFMATVLHLLVPPMFIYVHGAHPLNCYSERILPRLGTDEEKGNAWHLRYYDTGHSSIFAHCARPQNYW